MNHPEAFIPQRILMGPGPSGVDARVYQALSSPLLGHLDPDFLRLITEIQSMLRAVFQTGNSVTIPISGTGSAGMEAALLNLIEPGDSVLICEAGVFGQRMAEISRRAGGQVTALQTEWGTPIAPESFREAADRCHPRVIGIVHAETSTGVCQPLETVVQVAKQHEAILVVDTVTSLGGMPVAVDATGIDVCYSGTQKCLSCPPGLAPITLSDTALRRIRARITPVRSWYLDLSLVEKYWGSDRTYHHTAPISMNYALHEALRIVLEEGLQARWRRHELNHLALVAGIEAMGLQMLVLPQYRLWSLNAVRVPEGVDEALVRKQLLQQYQMEIGGGLGPLKGKIWRVGLMGCSSTRNNVLLFLAALENCLRVQHCHTPVGAGVSAASRFYASRDA